MEQKKLFDYARIGIRSCILYTLKNKKYSAELKEVIVSKFEKELAELI